MEETNALLEEMLRREIMLNALRARSKTRERRASTG